MSHWDEKSFPTKGSLNTANHLPLEGRGKNNSHSRHTRTNPFWNPPPPPSLRFRHDHSTYLLLWEKEMKRQEGAGWWNPNDAAWRQNEGFLKKKKKIADHWRLRQMTRSEAITSLLAGGNAKTGAWLQVCSATQTLSVSILTWLIRLQHAANS